MHKLAVAVSAVALVSIGGAAFAAIPDADGDIYACYAKQTGIVRVVEKATVCKSSETRTQWSASQPAPPTSYQVVQEETVESSGANQVIAECDQGDTVTGGGFDLVPIEVRVQTSRAVLGLDGLRGWVVTFANRDTTSHTVRAYVVCLRH
jgi:hypothetical protein